MLAHVHRERHVGVRVDRRHQGDGERGEPRPEPRGPRRRPPPSGTPHARHAERVERDRRQHPSQRERFPTPLGENGRGVGGGGDGEDVHAVHPPTGSVPVRIGQRSRRRTPARGPGSAAGMLESADMAQTSIASEHADGRTSPVRFGTIVFLASETLLFFGGLFAAYFTLRAETSPWPPEGADSTSRAPRSRPAPDRLEPHVPSALRAAERGSHTGLRGWVLATIVLGVAFLAIPALRLRAAPASACRSTRTARCSSR